MSSDAFPLRPEYELALLKTLLEILEECPKSQAEFAARSADSLPLEFRTAAHKVKCEATNIPKWTFAIGYVSADESKKLNKSVVKLHVYFTADINAPHETSYAVSRGDVNEEQRRKISEGFVGGIYGCMTDIEQIEWIGSSTRRKENGGECSVEFKFADIKKMRSSLQARMDELQKSIRGMYDFLSGRGADDAPRRR